MQQARAILNGRPAWNGDGPAAPQVGDERDLQRVLARQAKELAQMQQALAAAQADLRQQLGMQPDNIVWQAEDRSSYLAQRSKVHGLGRAELAWRLAEMDRLQSAVVEGLRGVGAALWQEIARLQQACARADTQRRELESRVAALRQQLNKNDSLRGGLASASPPTPQAPGQPPAGTSATAAAPTLQSAAANGAMIGAVIGGGVALIGAVLRGPMANALIVAVFGIVLLGLAGSVVGAACGSAYRILARKIPDIVAAWRQRREQNRR
jgi:hypothetical protein